MSSNKGSPVHTGMSHWPLSTEHQANAKFIKDIFDSPNMKANTRKNLKADWVSWLRFIEADIGMNVFSTYSMDQQLAPLMAYCQYLVDRNLKANSIRRRLAGLSSMLRLLGINDGVTGNPRFKFFAKNLLEARAVPSEQATPIDKAILDESLKMAFDSQNIKLIRAAVIVQLGFDSLCRASELMAVRQSDIRFNPDGSGVLFVRRSKSDQVALGSYRAFSATAGALIKKWIKMARLAGREEYLLCPVSAHSNAITRRNREIPETPIGYSSVLSDIKLFGSKYTAHSTRVGGLLALVKNGAKDYQIQLAGGWKSSTMIAHYSRELNVEEGAMRELFESMGR